MKKQPKMLKQLIFWCLGIIGVFFILIRIYYALTDDLRLSSIIHNTPYEDKWAIHSLVPAKEENLESILDQPYQYLGKGSQLYVFASADGRYVIKFFKFKHLRPAWYVDWIPSIGFLKELKDNITLRKQKKLSNLFESYKLAYEMNKEESGLVFIQLNTINNPKRNVIITDKLGLKHTLNLANISFILQKRGETLRSVLGRFLKNNDLSSAKKYINQILELYISEYKKGIYDHDHGVMQNTGFVNQQAVRFDVGKLLANASMKEKIIAKEDLLLVGVKMKIWIQKHHPKHYSELANFIDQKIDKLFN